jgi:hypothetical protein
MTSPLLPHARALLAAALAEQPGPYTVREDAIIDAHGPSSSFVVCDRDGMWVAECGSTAETAALIAAAPTLLASLCTALEASEAEAGRLRAQLAHLTAEAGAESCAAFAAEVNALRAQLAEAGRIALEMSGQTLDWDQEDFYRACVAGQLATIRTEALK